MPISGAVKWDAALPDPEKEEKMDIVLADLPCSGLGVLGKKPDLRYKMTPEKEEELVRLQQKILSVAQAYVKPGRHACVQYLYHTQGRERREHPVVSGEPSQVPSEEGAATASRSGQRRRVLHRGNGEGAPWIRKTLPHTIWKN